MNSKAQKAIYRRITDALGFGASGFCGLTHTPVVWETGYRRIHLHS